jgi:hypothetical protein
MANIPKLSLKMDDEDNNDDQKEKDLSQSPAAKRSRLDEPEKENDDSSNVKKHLARCGIGKSAHTKSSEVTECVYVHEIIGSTLPPLPLRLARLCCLRLARPYSRALPRLTRLLCSPALIHLPASRLALTSPRSQTTPESRHLS